MQRPGVAGVTVVVFTYHRPDGLNALLASIAAQDRGDLGLEVIICNNASSRRLGGMRHRRSEEHTSELQSLMRISYAVFCLTKNNQTTHTSTKDTSTHSMYNLLDTH